jgi:hypothetical protein
MPTFSTRPPSPISPSPAACPRFALSDDATQTGLPWPSRPCSRPTGHSVTRLVCPARQRQAQGRSSEVVVVLLCEALRELLLLALPLLHGLGVGQLVLVRVEGVAHRLDGVIVQVEAEGDPLVEGGPRLERRVDVALGGGGRG